MTDRKTEANLDETLDETFPASDPPSNTPTGGTKKSREMEEAHKSGGDESKPTGLPTDDRHQSETAHQK